MAPGTETPMEYMVEFFEGLFGIMAKVAEKAISRTYEEHQKRKRDFLENINGENIPHCIADEMSYNNTDISRKMAYGWSKKDREAYEAKFNALPEEEKQRRRDAFEKSALPKIKHQAQVYEADTQEVFDDLKAFSNHDRANQPIYQARLKGAGKNNQSSTGLNMNKNNEPKKENEIQQQLNSQSSKQRQKDEIKNNELDGKKSVEKEIKNKTEVKEGEKISKATNEVKDKKYVNLEVEERHNTIEYNNQKVKASNKVENHRYTELAVENKNKEEFRAKVKEGAEKRKQQSKNNFEIQKVNQAQNKKSNQL